MKKVIDYEYGESVNVNCRVWRIRAYRLSWFARHLPWFFRGGIFGVRGSENWFPIRIWPAGIAWPLIFQPSNESNAPVLAQKPGTLFFCGYLYPIFAPMLWMDVYTKQESILSLGNCQKWEQLFPLGRRWYSRCKMNQDKTFNFLLCSMYLNSDVTQV